MALSGQLGDNSTKVSERCSEFQGLTGLELLKPAAEDVLQRWLVSNRGPNKQRVGIWPIKTNPAIDPAASDRRLTPSEAAKLKFRADEACEHDQCWKRTAAI